MRPPDRSTDPDTADRPVAWSPLRSVFARLRQPRARLFAGLSLTAVLGLSAAGLVLAAGESAELAPQASVLINTIRTRLDSCGEDGLMSDGTLRQASMDGPTRRRPTLVYNARLASIAARHARAMVDQHFFDHVDPAGKTIGNRATEGGYRWRVVGENLAAGHDSIADAVRGWLLSTTHCRNLIDERFTEFGIALARSSDPNDPYGSYWVLVLGRPQSSEFAAR